MSTRVQRKKILNIDDEEETKEEVMHEDIQ